MDHLDQYNYEEEDLPSSLNEPLHARWADEDGYHAPTTEHIMHAYRWLNSTAMQIDIDPFFAAYQHALACFDLPMSLRQRLQACYAAAAACVAGEAYNEGLRYLGEAFELAEDLDDWAAWVELVALHAAVDSELYRYQRAAGYLADGLDVLKHATHMTRQPRWATLTVDLLLAHAACDYVLEDYATAQESLDQASIMTDELPNADLTRRRPSISWMKAIVARWRNDPAHALVQAQQAATAFSTATTPASSRSWGRLQSILADISLDLAEGLPPAPPHMPEMFLQLGSQYAADAVQYNQRTGDTIGEGIALLAQSRSDRLARLPSDRVNTIQQVIASAEQVGDAALMAQGYTALGIELLARTSSTISDSGLNCLRMALNVARSYEIPALGAWARRALVAAAR